MKQKKKDSKKMRLEILKAARIIFAKNSYTDASIRMIAKEGGVPHALIRYYFASKADLFDAVIENISLDLYEFCEEAVRETMYIKNPEGFSEFVQRFIDFSKEKPWVFKILLLNISAESVDKIPGQARISGVIELIRDQMIKNLKIKAPREEFCRFSDSFNALVFYYLGSSGSAAWLLHLEPESDEYHKWVHKTLVNIFLPALDNLFKYK